MISVLFGTILACDPIMLYKRIEGPPLRQQELSPVEGNRRSLNQCSRWCADKPQCHAVTWEPGSCTQVGPGSNGAIVGTTAFIVKRHPYALGKRSIIWQAEAKFRFYSNVRNCIKYNWLDLLIWSGIHTHTHTHIYIYTYIYIYFFIYIYICIYIYTYKSYSTLVGCVIMGTHDIFQFIVILYNFVNPMWSLLA